MSIHYFHIGGFVKVTRPFFHEHFQGLFPGCIHGIFKNAETDIGLIDRGEKFRDGLAEFHFRDTREKIFLKQQLKVKAKVALQDLIEEQRKLMAGNQARFGHQTHPQPGEEFFESRSEHLRVIRDGKS